MTSAYFGPSRKRVAEYVCPWCGRRFWAIPFAPCATPVCPECSEAME